MSARAVSFSAAPRAPSGYRVDDRALWQIADSGATPPELVLILRLNLQFLEGFHEYPACAALWEEDMGFDYRNFPGFEQMGYAVTDPLRPERGYLGIAALQPDMDEKLAGSDVLVYRLEEK